MSARRQYVVKVAFRDLDGMHLPGQVITLAEAAGRAVEASGIVEAVPAPEVDGESLVGSITSEEAVASDLPAVVLPEADGEPLVGSITSEETASNDLPSETLPEASSDPKEEVKSKPAPRKRRSTPRPKES